MKSLEELKAIREKAQAAIRLRDANDSVTIVVAMGTCGIAAGARQTMISMLDELTKRQRTDVLVTQTGCAGYCEIEPMVTVKMSGKSDVVYGDVTEARAREIVTNHIVNGQVITDYVLTVKEG